MAATTTPKKIVTTNPEVVRLSSRLMHDVGAPPFSKQISPALHLADGVVVGIQVVPVEAPEVTGMHHVVVIKSVVRHVRGASAVFVDAVVLAEETVGDVVEVCAVVLGALVDDAVEGAAVEEAAADVDSEFAEVLAAVVVAAAVDFALLLGVALVALAVV